MQLKFYNIIPNFSPSYEVEFPILVLMKDRWDDYGYRILYKLFLCKSRLESVEIGTIKILDKRTSNTALPETFTQLDNNYCSLGQSLEFYENLKKYLPETFIEVLNSLNDIAINSEIAKTFVLTEGYVRGLLRFNSAEKALNEAKILLLENRKKINDDLHFTYSVTVGGASARHEVNFDFKNNSDLPSRINVLIGKNGTGKTQFLGSMVNSISGVKYQKDFSPFCPLFRKIIAISYSLFDNFPKPENTPVFNYKYIGLRSKDEEIISDEKLEEKLRTALSTILDDERVGIWFEFVGKIVKLDYLGLHNISDLTKPWIKALSYKNVKRLSSGHSITLFILTELIANIQDESLILFDEPETHLHPSAISQLINVLFDILDKYKSYAIISTHAPIIIQDIPSKYITIFDREGDYPIIRKLPLESFGENISTLTSKIFGTIDVEELYKRFLNEMSHKSIKEIDLLFEKGLSINAQLYLTALKNIYSNEKS